MAGMTTREAHSMRRRGIVLITTLAILTFLVMLCVVLVTTGHSSLRRAATYSQSEQALHVALAGLAYAQSAFERNLLWMTPDVSGSYLTNLPGTTSCGNVTVTESSNGLVQGSMALATGQVAQFTISFNPTLLDAQYISCNNTGSASNATTMRHPDRTQAAVQTHRIVPANMVGIIVEGRVITGTGPNATVVASRLAEGTFGRDTTQLLDSVAYAGKDVKASLASNGEWTIGSANSFGERSTGMRSMGNVNMLTPDGDANQFNLGASKLHLTAGNQGYMTNTTTNQTTVLAANNNPENASASADRYPRVGKPDEVVPANLKYAGIQQGTYVVWPSGSSAEVRYYPDLSYTHAMGTPTYNSDMSLTIDGTTYKPGSGLPSGSSSYFQTTEAANGRPATVNVAFDRPTKVTRADGGEADHGLAILAATPSQAVVNFTFSPTGGSTAPAILKSTNQSVALEGDVVGTGSILTGQDLMIQGHNALAPGANVGMSLYAGGNAYIDPLTSPAASTASGDLSTKVMVALAADAGVTPGAAPTAAPAPAPTATPSPTVTPGTTITTTGGSVPISYVSPTQVDVTDEAGFLIGSSHTFTMTLPPAGQSVSQTYTGLRKYTCTLTNLGNGQYKVVTKWSEFLLGGDSTTAYFTMPDGTDGSGGGGATPTPSPTTTPSSTGLSGTVPVADIPQKALDLLNGPAPNDPTRTLAQVFGDAGYNPSQAQSYIVTLLTKNSTKSGGQVLVDLSGPAPLTANDQVFYGMVYACHDFKASAGGSNAVTVQGVVVAYGGTPGNYQAGQSLTYPGADGTGNLVMEGKTVNLIYDPTYLGGLLRVYQNTYMRSTRLFMMTD